MRIQGQSAPHRQIFMCKRSPGRRRPQGRVQGQYRSSGCWKYLEEPPGEQRRATKSYRYVGLGRSCRALTRRKPAWAVEYAQLKGCGPEEYAAARFHPQRALHQPYGREAFTAVGRMGFETGNVWNRPAVWATNFSMLPEKCETIICMAWADSISGRIAKQLYPRPTSPWLGLKPPTGRISMTLPL